jgi:hypothetical protein
MACFESGTVISLEAREAITLPHVRGTTVRVTQGTLWLTEENHRHDVVLRPGDNWLVESDGATVVEAQNDAVFCVVGRKGALLELPQRRSRRDASLWTRLATLATSFAMMPRQIPYV